MRHHLVHLRAGRGQATVLNDFGFMRNLSIGQLDHAEFLWQLVRFQPGTPAVFVFDNPQKLSLVAWLGTTLGRVLAAGAVLLARLAVAHRAALRPDGARSRSRRGGDCSTTCAQADVSSGRRAARRRSPRRRARRRCGGSRARRPTSPGSRRAERRERLAASFDLPPDEAGRVLRPAADTSTGGVRRRDARLPAHPRTAVPAIDQPDDWESMTTNRIPRGAARAGGQGGRRDARADRARDGRPGRGRRADAAPRCSPAATC